MGEYRRIIIYIQTIFQRRYRLKTPFLNAVVPKKQNKKGHQAGCLMAFKMESFLFSHRFWKSSSPMPNILVTPS